MTKIEIFIGLVWTEVLVFKEEVKAITVMSKM